MDQKNYAISAKELILKQTKHKGGTETFVYEPSNIEEEPLGNLYIIGWMKNGREELAFIPNLIASLMKREFYKQNGAPADILFEAGLKKANATLSDIAASNPNLSDLLGLCVINIAGEKIRFTQTSPVKALLYRDNSATDISHANKSGSKKEFFSSVVTGDIFSGDKLIFSTAKIFDIFSISGIKKLGSLNQDEQAEIINGLYQKNAKIASLSDQAAILLGVGKQKEKRVIAIKPMAAVSEAKNKIIKETKKIEIKFNKKHKIIAGAIVLFIVLSPLYLASQARLAAARLIRLNINKAEEIYSGDKESARSLLREAQDSLPILLSNSYLSDEVRKISDEIDRKISALDGIYKKTPVELAKLDLGAFKFSPRHIFDTQNAIYVFSSTADLAYKINKASKNTAFIPLAAGEQFTIERALEKNGDIYLISNSEQSAYVFYPPSEETVKVTKTLKKILDTPSKENSRAAGDTSYRADNPGKIIKETKNRSAPEKFLIGSDNIIIDLTLSADAKSIYILTENKILSIENR